MKQEFKSMKFYIKIFLIIFIAINVIYCIHPANAASGFIPNCDLSQTGSNPCQLNDFLFLAVNLINYMLAISGSLALLFFIWGGFKMLTAAGNSEGVEKGKQAITSAAIGILVVLASWMIVNFIYTSLAGTGQEGGKKIEWWQSK
ncbi:MAG: pilin [bacterium]